MAADRLDQLQWAHRAIQHSLECARRAGVARFQLAASRLLEGFARVYDTLVLELQPPSSRVQPQQLPPHAPHATVGAHLLREALLLLYAVSGCRGFSFHENPAFWSESLSLEVSPVVPITTQRFPRVVLDWLPRNVARIVEFDKVATQYELETSVLALFTMSPPPPPLSTLSQELLASVNDAVYDRPDSCIECDVVLHFASLVTATKALVSTVISAAHASTGCDAAPFVWVGVRLIERKDVKYTHHGLVSVSNLAILTRLCASLPPTLTVAIRLPVEHTGRRRTLPPSLTRALGPFLSPAIGVAATKWLGHMAVLDLTYRTHYLARHLPAFDFAELATLLPFARSLEKLCVAVATTSDLVWLMYAVVHPLTRTTKWRTLHLDGQHREPASWDVIHGLWQPLGLFASLWSLLTQPEDTITARDVSNRAGSGSEGFVRRTAHIASAAVVLSPDKSTTLAQLKAGREVELCDTATAIDALINKYGNADLDDLAVIVPGVGLGWIHKRHLSGITDTLYDGRPRSSLTTLALGCDVVTTSDLDTILQIFGPTLKHLRSLPYEPCAVSELARLCPQLESLELPRMQQHGHDMDAATEWTLPHLRDVGLISNTSSLDACFRLLDGLSALRTVRLRYHESGALYSPASWECVDQHVATLIAAKKRTLRRFTLLATYHRPQMPIPRLDQCMSCSADAKVAFLSVLHAARDAASRHRHIVLASLGADVVSLVFDFAGPSLMATDVCSHQMWPHDWYDPSPRGYW